MVIKVDEYIVKAIEYATKGEEIEKVVLGKLDKPDWFHPKQLTKEVISYTSTVDKVISWDDAKQTLENDIKIGYGAMGFRSIYVWTKTLVIFVIQCSDLTWIDSVPRNPTNGEPFVYGG